MTQEYENVVQWVYASKNEQELKERYDKWAATYEEDLDRDIGWYGPIRAVESAVKYFAKDAHILDAGAGTGLVGKLLSERGYTDLVAMDFSEGMLAHAREKDVYKEFHLMTMGETLDFPTDAFDATITVGVLTVGHAPARSLDELVRVTRPGGHFIYTLRPDLYEEGGFKEKHAELESAGKWKLTEVGEPTQFHPIGEPEVLHQVWVFEVTA